MAWPPAVADFQAQFMREFIYGDGLDTVTDSDIQRALNEAPARFNQSLLNSATAQVSAFLYLAAHILWTNINNAGGLSAVQRGRGVRSQPEGITISKAVGQVNVTFQAPPEWVSKSTLLSELWKSPFGQIYVSMVYSQTAANALVVCGPNPNQWNNE